MTRCARRRHSIGTSIPRCRASSWSTRSRTRRRSRCAWPMRSGDRLWGVRLDTPSERGRVTPELVKEVRARLDLAGHPTRQDRRLRRHRRRAHRRLQGGRRAGRLVRGRQRHQQGQPDRLHRRPQGDRWAARRQARPHPRTHREPTAGADRPPALGLTDAGSPTSASRAYELFQRGSRMLADRHPGGRGRAARARAGPRAG